MSVLGKKIRQRVSPEYKDPWEPKYFGFKGTRYIEGIGDVHIGQTQTQKEVSDILRAAQRRSEETGRLKGGRVAMIGAKGSAKSWGLSGCHLVDNVQKYPGSKYGIAANSYAQAFGSGAEKLVNVARGMGIPFEFKRESVIDGMMHYNVYHFPDFDSKVCVLSFEKMGLIEGTEWDGFSFEEVQDCEYLPIQTAISRVRRGIGDHSNVASGMPDDEGHWMYELLPEWGFELFEPSVYENLGNLPDDYLETLQSVYKGNDAKRYIEGERVSLFKNLVFYNFKYRLHVAHENFSRLTQYDPALPIVMVWDFNISPISVAMFQKKRVPAEWASGDEPYEIWAQIDEIEGWGTGTERVCEEIGERYKDHIEGGIVLGDSSGNARDTRTPGKTDWKIISNYFARMGNGFRIIRGLKSSLDSVQKTTRGSTSQVKYYNPPIRDTIDAANNLLLRPDGDPGVVFLPQSQYESGGLAKSVRQQKADPSGSIDKKNDKREGRQIIRSHFSDVFRYFAYWAVGRGASQREALSKLAKKTARNDRFLGKLRMPWS